MTKKRGFTTAAVAAPKFTDPGLALALADVPKMPAEAAAHFAAHGIRTLADLRPLIEERAAADSQCEPVFDIVGVRGLELPVLVRYKASDALIGLLGGRVHMLRVMAGWDRKPAPVAQFSPDLLEGFDRPPTAPAVKADDFDEHTPPPRQRPCGEPVARNVELPAGEPVIELFRRWDRDGRIEPGCVLAERTRDGHVLLVGQLAGVATGEVIPVAVIEPLALRAAVRLKAGRFPEVPRSFAVLMLTKGAQ